LTPADMVVLRFRGGRVPRALRDLPVHDVANPTDVDPLVGAHRMIVLGGRADLGIVLTRLLRAERLDVEVGLVGRPWHARRARTAGARRECVVDDIVLFDGEVTGVRIEPTADPPGLRASVLTSGMRRRRWVTGRAAQLGTTGALVVRDGVTAPRPVRRSTFYRHTQGWLTVG
jgi:hypothetical protein